MPVNKKEIKKALDHFENDEYSQAQDILKKEIAKHRDEWLDQKLDLKGETDTSAEADADADDAEDE